jgi:hypothetical protein
MSLAMAPATAAAGFTFVAGIAPWLR